MTSFGQNSLVSIIQSYQPNEHALRQVWNLRLHNHSSEKLSVWLEAQVSDISRKIYDAKAGPVELLPGLNQIRFEDLQGLQEVSADGSILRPESNLREGLHRYCVSVFGNEGQLLASQCQDLVFPNVLPPHLVYPFNQDQIEELFPVFSWTNPAPIPQGARLSHQLRLVELLPGQSAAAAVLHNPALYLREDLITNVHPYPVSQPPLDPTKTYAWKVDVYADGAFLGQTESWSFSFRREGESEKEKNDRPYTELSRLAERHNHIARGEVRFRMDCRYGEQAPIWEIYDASRRKVKVRTENLLKKGNNQFVISLPAGSGLRAGNTYYLDICNAKEEHFLLSFLYLTE
ncbi:MAG: hypothetical protein AAF206_23855 [Bacteroidota bacterium]